MNDFLKKKHECAPWQANEKLKALAVFREKLATGYYDNMEEKRYKAAMSAMQKIEANEAYYLERVKELNSNMARKNGNVSYAKLLEKVTMSKTDFAAYLGVTRGTLDNYIKGKTNIPDSKKELIKEYIQNLKK